MGILSAVDVVKTFPGRGRERGTGRRRVVHAVQGVSIDVEQGHSLAIVGESGSGKTTLARMLLGIEHPTNGEILFRGQAMSRMRRRELRAARRDLQMIFQDPYESLDPRLTVTETVATALLGAGRSMAGKREQLVRDALLLAGLSPVESYLDKRPAELSGGQRQRVAIARAMVTRPDVVVADEPVSMLDVSIQAGVLNTLLDAQQETGSTYVIITHDLGVARYVADQVAVMYAGRVVEAGPADSVLAGPAHPYTALLIASAAHEPRPPQATPRPDPRESDRPSGCPYAGRCARADDLCRSAVPPLEVLLAGGSAACFHPLDHSRTRADAPIRPGPEEEPR